MARSLLTARPRTGTDAAYVYDAYADAAQRWPDGSLVPAPYVDICPSSTTFIQDNPTCEMAVDSGCGCIEVAADMTCQAYCRGNLPCPPPCD